MVGVIYKYLRGGVRLVDKCLYTLHRDALVISAEMRDCGAFWRLVGIYCRHKTAIIAAGGRKIIAGASKCPSHRPAIAIARDENGAFTLQRINTDLRVIQRLCKGMQIAGQFDRAIIIGAGIVRLKTRMLAIKNSR